MVYLDHNATTPLDERVLDAMLPYLQTFYGNPNSLYRHGRIARSAIDTARAQVAALIDAEPEQVIFTSGGTEANNLAMAALPPGARLAVSAIEHPSVLEPARHLAATGHPLAIIASDALGVISDPAIDRLMPFRPDWVSIMLANNETGAIQPIARHAERLKAGGVTVHSDAVQALGKIPLSFRQLGVDLLTLSAHKIYGPKGSGALVCRKNLVVPPLLRGGGQEQGFRAGTENVAAIVGFGKAAELASAELTERSVRLLKLRNLLERGLAELVGATIFAREAERLPNTVQFGIDGTDGEMLLMRLDQKGFAVSSGSACASGGKAPSPVLTAMAVGDELVRTAIRVSFGVGNAEADVIQFINVLKDLLKQA